VSKWRTMETAPKDGTQILICGGTFTNDLCFGGPFEFRGPTIVYWCDGGWCGDNAGAHDSYCWHTPTHWIPLPEPPVSEPDMTEPRNG
jgi:hypothetical protein